jgi:hypothetical protein
VAIVAFGVIAVFAVACSGGEQAANSGVTAGGSAQGPTAPPAIYYGFGLDEGDLVATFNTRAGCEQVLCEQALVNGDGFGVLRIAGDAVCGVEDGDTIVFAVNGEPVDHTESWASGGVPADVARGIALR